MAIGLAAFAEDAPRFVNPIYEQADPWFTQDGNRYLACFSDGSSAVSIHISERLTVPGVKHIVWTAPATGPASREVWAPELHHIGKHWYVYFAERVVEAVKRAEGKGLTYDQCVGRE